MPRDLERDLERIAESQAAAARRAAEVFEVGSRWLKQIRGRRFIVEVEADGRLVESLEDRPSERWGGSWEIGSRYNGTDDEPGVILRIGEFEDHLRIVGVGLVGYEWHSGDPPPLVHHTGAVIWAQDLPGVELTRID